ncbi:FAD-binding oxidoreductase [Geodermatophilus bullaregiensis]|uniref:FAD-binding oxidoreductase n=1 Tax=Geodermatophilus bullaregiensis TaxID=1564160 RepID=UPI0027DD86D9|nr:FAD-binding oxidoreductase [Geodermatophilus bullaregiensis]
MARAAVQRRLTWLRARLTDNLPASTRVRRLVFDVDGWPGHLPGQHVDVRLTAEDGYTAQRSYSIASPPEDPRLHLLVEDLPGGEVSPYLTEEMQAGDDLELRGPIGGYFVWSAAADAATPADRRRPVQLVAGGAGVSPFLAMLDHARRAGDPTPVRLLYSARTADDVLGGDLLGPGATVTLTRGAPPDWTGPTGRVDGALLQEHAFPPDARPRVFVCGPTVFVETVATTLVDLGHSPSAIRLERFGGTGDPA